MMAGERDFTNELGNHIRLTIEGPTSASVNELTEAETVEVAAFVREYVKQHPHLEDAYQRRRLEKPSRTARKTLDCFTRSAQLSVADELLIYADKLRTWTLAEEEVGNVRSLPALLRDAAVALLPLELVEKVCPTCEGRGVYDSYPIDGKGCAMEFECYTCDGKGALAATPLVKLREALFDIRNRILCPVGPQPTLDQIQEIASAALSHSSTTTGEE